MTERFLKAGIDAADAARTIGPALKLRTQGNSFATLDVGTIDLFSGTAQSIKCGAAPSFLRVVDGDGSVRIRKILSATLPAGLEESGEMDVTRFRMGSGDAMVLLSDGVIESGGSSSIWIEELLMQSMHLSARELAARIVLEASARGAPDDMTAAVLYLDKRSV
jgi:serine phosphatase RsbU (regulator of sigma subunit)